MSSPSTKTDVESLSEVSTSPFASPFAIETDLPFVALCGQRNGYIQLAPSQEQTRYLDVNPRLFLLAYHWCQELELLKAQKVYWLTLSEQVPHLHIHLYPRWFTHEPKGLVLFETREQAPQPAWNQTTVNALKAWAEQFKVAVTLPKVEA
jgi:diadenosine tetraphosphate (Ap4A) HIT family hydrolase